ncbi:AbrB/MazE/SpoVT family DNA-binding domain-containing protein [Candidatus Woesearchaeota archaeon]|nr:AbrB/MazE/SpoVT family DNA-binding domain-containing protein [Candidatus Woesearchaeota archaeon]
MTEIQAVARKWGDSLAIIIPNDVVKAHNIKPQDKITVIIPKMIDLSDLAGKFSTKKTAQQIKDEMRSGW